MLQVELIDVGLDEGASDVLLHALLGRAKTITRLDLSRNGIGVRGAAALARYIAQKGVSVYIQGSNRSSVGPS